MQVVLLPMVRDGHQKVVAKLIFAAGFANTASPTATGLPMLEFETACLGRAIAAAPTPDAETAAAWTQGPHQNGSLPSDRHKGRTSRCNLP